MTNQNKKRLCVLGYTISMFCALASIPSSFFIDRQYHPTLVLVTIGLFGLAFFATLMTGVESTTPRPPPTHVLPASAQQPASYDAVSIPSTFELVRTFLIFLAIFLGAIGAILWWFTPHINPYEWLPWVLILTGAGIYLHESLYGPHRDHFWIATVWGEWTGRPWGRRVMVTVLYPVQERTPPEERFHRFLGRPTFFAKWVEVLVKQGNTNVVSYVTVPRELYRELEPGTQIPVQNRVSRLDPSRLQLRLALE